jgi:hypothetical protein
VVGWGGLVGKAIRHTSLQRRVAVTLVCGFCRLNIQ